MARARNIKPGFFRNADLAELPVEARLLFIGLWTISDRDGRLNDRPKQIKMEIYPGDSFDVDSLLQKLHDSKFIQRYEVNNIKYIHILNFVKHQNPHVKEQASEIPSPVMPGASTVQVQDKPVVCTEVATLNPSSLNPESLLLNPESPLLNPEPLKPIPEKKPTVANAPRGERETCFDQFWEAYPAKVGRGDAIKAWKKITSLIPETLELILQALSWQRDCPAWLKNDGQYIPNPATYLNGKRWLDEPRKQSPPGTTEVGRPLTRDEGRAIAARSIFKDEHIQHLQGEKNEPAIDAKCTRIE